MQIAKRHNIWLAVKSSGHDYLGPPLQRAELPVHLIWTHHLASIIIHKDNAMLASCDIEVGGDAVNVAGGENMWDVHEGLAPVSRMVVGGTWRTISVGGYLTGVWGGGDTPL